MPESSLKVQRLLWSALYFNSKGGIAKISAGVGAMILKEDKVLLQMHRTRMKADGQRKINSLCFLLVSEEMSQTVFKFRVRTELGSGSQKHANFMA